MFLPLFFYLTSVVLSLVVSLFTSLNSLTNVDANDPQISEHIVLGAHFDIWIYLCLHFSRSTQGNMLVNLNGRQRVV